MDRLPPAAAGHRPHQTQTPRMRLGPFSPMANELAENVTFKDVRAPSWSQCLGIELADAAAGADNEWEGEGVPVFVGVRWVGV